MVVALVQRALIVCRAKVRVTAEWGQLPQFLISMAHQLLLLLLCLREGASEAVPRVCVFKAQLSVG